MAIANRDTVRSEPEIFVRKGGSEAQAKYEALERHISAVTYFGTADAFSSTIYISPQIESLAGYSPQEWIPDRQLWMKRLHPDD